MERENFVRKLSVLLDILSSNNNKLVINGICKTEGGISFFVKKNEMNLYDVSLWIGDDMVASVSEVGKDVVLLMFTVYTSNKIRELSVSVTD